MTKAIRRLKKISLAGICLLFLLACTSDELSADMTHETGETAFMTAVLNLSDGSSVLTRAGSVPSGGEDGDGREQGINNENSVYNVTLLFFSSLSPDAKAIEALKFGAGDLRQPAVGTVETVARKVSVSYHGYHVVAIVNDNDHFSTNYYQGMTLSDVCNSVIGTPWQDDSDFSKADCFTMTSCVSDARLSLRSGSGAVLGTSPDNPVTVKITVERLAARVDIDAYDEHTGTNASTLVYDYLDKAGAKIGRVKIHELRLLNRFTGGTYLLKHFSTVDDYPASTYYYNTQATMEGPSPLQQQYIIDPMTTSKRLGVVPDYYDSPVPASLKDGVAWSSTAPTQEADRVVPAHSPAQPTDGHRYFILGYAQENTLPKAAAADIPALLPRYATALAAKYEIIDTEDGSTSGIYYDVFYLMHNNTDGSLASPMHYGIVRNNIYRVALVPPVKVDSGLVPLAIRVKCWDPYLHDYIYM